MVASRGGYRMARGRHYAKLSLSNAARLSFSDLCILLFMFLSLCRLCVCVFLCSHWSLVDVPLIFFCPADHVPDWQPRVLLGMVEARSVNVKKTTTQQHAHGFWAPPQTFCCFFELGDGANKGVQKGCSTHYPILSTNPQGRPPVVLEIYILPHFVHRSTPLCSRPRNIVAPQRTIRKWFRRLAFWILRTRAQDPCSCCCRPTPRHQDGKILLR